jgi:SPP1 family predicted phage head-tail adaptor
VPRPPRVLFDRHDWVHRVAFQRTSYAADDGAGNRAVTLTLRRNVPCFVKLGPLAENKSNDRQQAEANHTVTLTTDPRVRNGDRVIYGDRLFVVTSAVNEYDLNLIWTVACTEIVA